MSPDTANLTIATRQKSLLSLLWRLQFIKLKFVRWLTILTIIILLIMLIYGLVSILIAKRHYWQNVYSNDLNQHRTLIQVDLKRSTITLAPDFSLSLLALIGRARGGLASQSRILQKIVRDPNAKEAVKLKNSTQIWAARVDGDRLAYKQVTLNDLKAGEPLMLLYRLHPLTGKPWYPRRIFVNRPIIDRVKSIDASTGNGWLILGSKYSNEIRLKITAGSLFYRGFLGEGSKTYDQRVKKDFSGQPVDEFDHYLNGGQETQVVELQNLKKITAGDIKIGDAIMVMTRVPIERIKSGRSSIDQRELWLPEVTVAVVCEDCRY